MYFVPVVDSRGATGSLLTGGKGIKTGTVVTPMNTETLFISNTREKHNQCEVSISEGNPDAPRGAFSACSLLKTVCGSLLSTKQYRREIFYNRV